MMIEIDDETLETLEIEGADGSFWSPYYAVSYFIGYMVGAYEAAGVKCGCDQSLSMT